MLHRFLDDDGIAAVAGADIPLQRVGRPEEIAELVVWLAGPHSSYVNGETIRIDGGLLAGRML